MKIKKEKAWFNVKCAECGKLIYPEDVIRAKPEKAKRAKTLIWKFCEDCFSTLFNQEEVNVEEKYQDDE